MKRLSLLISEMAMLERGGGEKVIKLIMCKVIVVTQQFDSLQYCTACRTPRSRGGQSKPAEAGGEH